MKRTLLVIFLLAWIPAVFLAQNRVDFEPVAGWIVEQKVPSDKRQSAEDSSNGLVLLLMDEQYDVESQTSFEHYVRKILNTTALQDEAKLTMTFDASYQKLKVHYVVLHRGNRTINLLDRRHLNVIQQEQDLEYNRYDGRLTAVLLLNDVRVGDVLDYAYSLKGENPIFGKHFLGSFRLKYDLPVKKMYYRMRMPAGRKVNIKYHGDSLKPVTKVTSNYTDCIWERDEVEPIIANKNVPAWYDIYPWIQLSEFNSWREVALLANDLFKLEKQEINALNSTIRELKRKTKSQEDYVRASLRFVQDDIRYFGIEIGISAHKPASPSKVLKQRFGDCKDKSLLLCALLKGAGIQAWPVLVNTELENEVAKIHPSPVAFNHTVVRIVIADKERFFDPTLTNQRGTFSLLYFPYKLKGLIIDSTTTDLVLINENYESYSRSEILETFIIPGFSTPVKLKVISKFYGQEANRLRAYYAQSTPLKLEEIGHEYYSQEYQKVVTIKPLAIQEDDEEANILTVTEEYRIDSLWLKSAKVNRLEGTFYATLLRQQLFDPSSSKRIMPLALNYPVNMIYITKVLLPETWNVDANNASIQDSAFSFESSIKCIGKDLTISYQYKTKKDFVLPGQVPSYSEHVTKALSNIGYSLYKYHEDPGNVSWILSVFLFLGLTVCIIFLFLKWLRHIQRPAITYSGSDSISQGVVSNGITIESEFRISPYNKIGGWLIIPAIGLVISPFFLMFQTVKSFGPVFNKARWDEITNSSLADYNPWTAPTVIGELLANIGLFIFTLVAAIYFFRRKKHTPGLIIIWFAVRAALPIIDSLLVWILGITTSSFPKIEISDITTLIGSVVIWIPYFLKSVRVKNTFIH